MAISCDPSTLANAARCFHDCIHSHALQQSVKSYLLCQYSNVPVGPVAPTNPDIADASVFNDVIFTWTNPVPAGTSNEIWKSTNGGAFVLYATVGGGVSSFHDPLPLNVLGLSFAYKVRTISAAGTSAFTATRSVVHDINKTGAADVSLSLPDLVMQLSNGGFGLFFDNMPNLTTFSAPLLRRVDDQMNFSGSAALASVTLTALDNVGVTNADNFFFDNCTSIATLSLPALKTVGNGGGNFHLTGCTALTSLSLPVLNNVGGDFNFDSCTSLPSISCPLLAKVDESLRGDISGFTTASFPVLATVGIDVSFISCPNLTTLTLTVLNDVQGSFVMTATTALTSLSAPLLANVAGDVDFSGGVNSAPINLPALGTVGGSLKGNNSGITAFSCAALTSVGNTVEFTTSTITSLNLSSLTSISGDFLFSGCTSLVTVSAGALTSIGNELLGNGCTSLTTLTLTSLNLVFGGNFNISGCTALATLSLPAGVTIAQNFNASLCTNLANVSIPVIIFQDGFLVDFHGCAIVAGNSAAGTGINGILRRGVASGTTASDYELNSPGNATPGASGLADKATLIGAGNTVVTN